MNIADLKEGTELDVVAKQDNVKIEFHTSVVRSYDGGILVKPIMYNGKLLDFSGKGLDIRAAAVVEKGAQPAVWRGVVITNVWSKNEIYSYIKCPTAANFENRRKAFRVPLYAKVRIQFGDQRRMEEAVTRDISATGFSFMMKDENVTCEMGENIVCEFIESKLGKTPRMKGVLVRKVETSEGIRYGCRILSSNTNMGMFAAECQREQQARMRGGDRTMRRPIR